MAPFDTPDGFWNGLKRDFGRDHGEEGLLAVVRYENALMDYHNHTDFSFGHLDPIPREKQSNPTACCQVWAKAGRPCDGPLIERAVIEYANLGQFLYARTDAELTRNWYWKDEWAEPNGGYLIEVLSAIEDDAEGELDPPGGTLFPKFDRDAYFRELSEDIERGRAGGGEVVENEDSGRGEDGV